MSHAAEPAQRAAPRPKPGAIPNKYSIDIVIDRHFRSMVYTSGSTISGRAIVKTARDVAFDYFDIVFTGIAATRLDFVQQYPSHSFRPFLKLRMPIAESDIPQSRIFSAGREYSIPFHFVVPHQLPIGACSHNCESDAVKDYHLRLPPSVGFWGADDQSPEMAQVEYAVKARAITYKPGTPAVKVLEGHHMVKVLPALPEDPPLDITFRDERYTLSKTKTIRKNLFSAKAGKLTAAATQPGAVMLSTDGHKSTPSSARVNLEFIPDSVDTAPPKVNSVAAKVVSTTFFGAAPVDHLPNLGPRTAYHSNPCLNYTITTNLFNLPVDKLTWKQEKMSAGRRDSGYSSSHMDVDVSETNVVESNGQDSNTKVKVNKKSISPIKHITDLEIPFTINSTNKRFFLPTFHSCLISLPLQIGVETIHEQQGSEELPSFEAAIAQSEEQEANSYLRPRIMRLPSDVAQSNSLLPGYDELRRQVIAPVA